MARNIKQQAADGDEIAPDAIMVPGGASGVPDDPNPMATAIGGPRVAQGRVDPDAPPPVPSRRYKVVGGPKADENGRYRVMYAGMSTHVAPGKIYEEHHADLDLLRRQGIVLEEILP